MTKFTIDSILSISLPDTTAKFAITEHTESSLIFKLRVNDPLIDYGFLNWEYKRP